MAQPRRWSLPVRGAAYGAVVLGALLAFIFVSTQFNVFPHAGSSALLVLALFTTVIAHLLGFPLSEGTAIAAFPRTLGGKLVGCLGILLVFFLFGLVLAFIVDRIKQLGSNK